MKHRFFLLLLAFSFYPANAAEHNTLKVGTGFTGDSLNWGIAVDLASPNLFKFSPLGSKQKAGIALFAKGDIRLYSRGTYNGAIPFVALGLRGTRFVPDYSSGFYSIIALNMAFVGSTISSESLKPGLLLIWGYDFLIEKDMEDFLFGLNDCTFFVEGNVQIHGQVDRLAANPDLLTGFYPRVGLRAHF